MVHHAPQFIVVALIYIGQAYCSLASSVPLWRLWWIVMRCWCWWLRESWNCIFLTGGEDYRLQLLKQEACRRSPHSFLLHRWTQGTCKKRPRWRRSEGFFQKSLDSEFISYYILHLLNEIQFQLLFPLPCQHVEKIIGYKSQTRVF